MLPKKQRIPRSLFSVLRKQGKSISNNLFFLNFLKQDKNLSSRFGFTVSKKISNKAVLRNKYRRMGYRNILLAKQGSSRGLILNFIYRRKPSDDLEVLEYVGDLLKKINI